MSWFTVAGLAVAAAASAAPQAPPARSGVPVFGAETELVQLDVVVTDPDGRPVAGIRREEFTLLEDGRPQHLTHFAVGTAVRPALLAAVERSGAAPAAIPAGASPPPEVPASRSIVLVFDDLHIGASPLMVSKREAIRFVEEQVSPRDRVGLVTTSGVRGGAQPLTRDRAAVLRAIGRVTLQDRSARARFARPYISEQQAEQISRFGELASAGNDAFELAVGQFVEEYRFLTRSVAEAMVRDRVREILAEGARYTRASLSTLESTVRGLAPVPGRKLVVLLTQGFYLGRGTLYETAYDLRRIADAATRANVVIYSIDVGGLTVPTPAGDVTERTPVDFVRRSRVEWGMDENRREAMRAVAEETGGFAVLNRNDLAAGFRKVLADNDQYYLLAYTPAGSGKPRRFRRIEVRVPGRRGLVVRSRRGYFPTLPVEPPRVPAVAADAEAAIRTRAREALTSIAPLAGVPLDLSAEFVDLPDAGPVVVVNVGVDAASPPFAPAGGGVEIFVVATDEDGAVADQFAGRLVLPEVADRSLLGAPRRIVNRQLRLAPGRYQVRVAALDRGSTRAGSASQWVEVPDLQAGRLALSDLFLSPATAAEAESAGGPPTSRWRRFPPGGELDVVLFVYNAKLDERQVPDLLIRFRLLRDGRLLHEFQPRRMAAEGGPVADRIPGGARLSLFGLPPGEYELGALVEDRRAGTTAERRAAFSVE